MGNQGSAEIDKDREEYHFIVKGEDQEEERDKAEKKNSGDGGGIGKDNKANKNVDGGGTTTSSSGTGSTSAIMVGSTKDTLSESIVHVSIDEGTTGKATAATAGAAVAVVGVGTTSSSAATTPRRIVKASHPKPSPADTLSMSQSGVLVSSDVKADGGVGGGNNSDRDGDDDDDDDKGGGDRHHMDSSTGSKRGRGVPFLIAESPPVARELEIEKIEKQKKERMQDTAGRRQARREKNLEERRRNASTPTPRGDADVVKANPMSRFLSIFSVEPQHPDHKRSFDSNDSDIQEPSGKRLRSDNDDGPESAAADRGVGGEGDGGGGGGPWSPIALAAAVAVAAVVVGVALRWARSKK